MPTGQESGRYAVAEMNGGLTEQANDGGETTLFLYT
jgi:hypothetical protein